MNEQKSLKIRLELVWWAVTAVVALAALLPLWKYLEYYPFLIANIAAIIAFITFTRKIFLFQHSLLGNQQIIKMVLMVLCIPIFFYFINQVNAFQTVMDEQGVDALLGPEQEIGKLSLARYARTEFVFFAVGSVIATVVFFFRMMISIWRYRNRGTV
ncbi:MAG: hypothetical protein HKN16_13455 [Saprospiraceae bacterium]|nr:hypothetical protein [Saprospiraceae bacterium]